MFSNAYEIVSDFTAPIIISSRFFDGTVECGIGSFIFINPEGWIMTAAHMFNIDFQFQEHKKDINKYYEQIEIINQDSSLQPIQKQRKIKRLQTNPKWITNISYFFGQGNFRLSSVNLLPEADLAIGKFDNFDSSKVKTYPVFKKSENLKLGTSLCKLGFPFHQAKATFNQETDTFNLEPGVLPVPRFPIEGIFTRNIDAGKSRDGLFDIKYIETSSPGLRGQSGGPIFDVNGTIWAIQSRTIHLDLGFKPEVTRNGRKIEENQFINCGVGAHPEVIISFLRRNNINFQISDY